MFKYRLEAAAWSAAAALLRILPDALLPLVARIHARIGFDVLRFRRDVTLANLATAFPELSIAQRKQIARKSYESVLYSMREFVRLDRTDGLKAEGLRIDLVNEHHLQEVREKGAFVATLGHLGSWEFLPSFWAAQGARMAILYKPMHNPIIEARFEKLRRNPNVHYISTRLDPRQMWKELKDAASERRALVFLADQDARRDGVFVPFFGKNASTAAGPATVALRMNLPILPLSCVRMGQGHFRVEFMPPIYPPEGGRTVDNVRRLTEQHVAALEAAVRQYPEQYMWFHRRWKSTPRKSA